MTDIVDGQKFANEHGLTFVSLPRVVTIKIAAFRYAEHIAGVDLPNVERIESNAFRSSKVTRLIFPKLTFISANAFGGVDDQKVTTIYLPRLKDPDTTPDHTN
ncbi:MAG: hypothetical protein DSZ00_01480 [Gammaproteobacteria bacterium]|nr:MAG: hypothetical protein DSZ00_01480 [Gammaproteobacteria bacterium]